MRLLAAAFWLMATPSLAQVIQPAACGGSYSRRTALDAAALVHGSRDMAADAVSVWGRQNLRLLAPDETILGPVLRVSYPAGSINPGNGGAPLGGAGFQLPFRVAAQAVCLRYRVRFPADFEFGLGGKLPGLYGGDAPRGCGPGQLARGFSARLMWRSGGAGEVYLYSPDRDVRCGDSIGRGTWTFERDRWVVVDEEVVMNAPGRADGVIRIWVDGRRVLDHGGLRLREGAEIGVDGLLFSTFFGGNDPTWASPRDQSADFAGFEVWDSGTRP